MKRSVDAEEVARLAKLSRLEFDGKQAEDMRGHLSKMLDYFDALDSVDVSDVPPTAHILSAVNVLREDVVEPSTSNAELLKNAPESRDGAYVVPRVVE